MTSCCIGGCVFSHLCSVVCCVSHVCWIRDSDDVIIDAGNDAGVNGMGMTFDEWYAKYESGSQDYQ